MASTTVDPTVVVLEVLNQFSNYERWNLAVKHYLMAEDLWDIVEDGIEPSKDDEAKFKTWRKNNARALRTIQNCCGTYHYNFISKTNSAKEAWDILAKMFEPVFFEITDINHNDDDYNDYNDEEEFFNDVVRGNWRTALEFLVQNPGAVRATIPNLGCTVLHTAVKTKQEHIVEQLVELMKEEDLEIKDNFGCMAVQYAVAMDNIQMVECMVDKNENLLSIGFPPQDLLPVLWAYSRGQWEMSRYLYDHTPLTALKSRSGAQLISESLTEKEVDIAWDLIRSCPSLAIATDYFGHSPLNALAGRRCAFLSGRPRRFWEQWIYDSIHIEPTLIPPAIDDIQIDVPREENNEDNLRHINRTGVGSLRQLTTCLLKPLVSGVGLLRQLATSILKLLVSGHYNRIYQMKLIHEQSLAFLRVMLEVTKNKNLQEMQLRFVQSAIFRAVDRGHIEFITHILKANSDYVWMKNAQGMNMFQFAIECRQEKVYSLIYGFNSSERRILMGGTVNNLNDTPLHLVGRITSNAKLDHIQDAALRMQRELQWFKEVEGIVPQSHGDIMNFTDNMTPPELFTKNHKELKKEAEKSMKGTATSCTVVGALIATMMFAAAFTIPGGNKGDTGIPALIHEKWFMVFLVADVISLCLSTTSVIIFLGILTSRYAEVDFLKSLPTKMIFGLVTLFLSIITMMISFSSAVYIMLEGKSGIGIPVILLGGIPVTTFVLMQFHLLKEMVISTYGPEIFHRKVEADYKQVSSNTTFISKTIKQETAVSSR